MIKKITFPILISSILLSCSNPNREIRTVDCIVISCENKKKIISVHDEINRDFKRWEIKTSCGYCFLSASPRSIGDTLEVVIEEKI